jgi:uncharacterized membrane protein
MTGFALARAVGLNELHLLARLARAQPLFGASQLAYAFEVTHMDKSRIEAFSDGVFAFAFTLLIVDFHAPETTADLRAYLFSLWPQLLASCISFLLIGLIWANHRAMFLHMQRVDRMAMFLNVLLMADVAFLPFPTSVLAKAIGAKQGLAEAAFFYGLVLTVGGVFFNAFWLYASAQLATTDKETARRHRRRISLRFATGPLAYLLATLCALWSPVLSIALYVALIVYFWMPGRSDEPIAT